MKITFFLAGEPHPVAEHSPVWDSPLPMDRKGSPARNAESVTFGDYFLAVKRFVFADNAAVLKMGVKRLTRNTVLADQIDSIRIYSEKHGEFYHPARITVHAGGNTLHFVLNVAISDIGKRYIRDEYHRLDSLSRNCRCNFLPSVYGFGHAAVPGKGIQLEMFLGEWFDQYFEFHISGERPLSEKAVAVWRPGKKHRYLSLEQKYSLYREISRILTYYYDFESFAQIYPWHHAAGDFVVRVEDGQVSVKVITARGYGSHADNQEREPVAYFMGLALFLLNLSIRNRIDRIDGVGDFVWSDPVAVQATIEGFFKALFEKPAPEWMDGPLWKFFKIYLNSFSMGDFLELFRSILESYKDNAAQFKLIGDNLDEHCRWFHHCLSHHLSDCPG